MGKDYEDSQVESPFRGNGFLFNHYVPKGPVVKYQVLGVEHEGPFEKRNSAAVKVEDFQKDLGKVVDVELTFVITVYQVHKGRLGLRVLKPPGDSSQRRQGLD